MPFETSPHPKTSSRQSYLSLLAIVIFVLLLASAFVVISPVRSAQGTRGADLEVYVGSGPDMYPDLEAAMEDIDGEKYDVLTIYLNPGIYETSLLLYDSTVLVGSDPRTTILIPDSRVPILRLRDSSFSVSGIGFRGYQEGWVEEPENITAIDASDAELLEIRDCIFEDLYIGTDLDKCPYTEMTNVTFTFSDTAVLARDCENLSLVDCRFSFLDRAMDLGRTGPVWMDQVMLTDLTGDGILLTECTEVGIQQSVISCNGTGITLDGCDLIEIGYSFITDCHTGFNLTGGSVNVTIGVNEISRCSGYGVYVDNCTQNYVINNNFLNNSVHAFDSGNNSWNHTRESVGGNHWGDYNGTDEDGDGLVPFEIIGGDQRDEYPLIEPLHIEMPGPEEEMVPGLIDLIFSIPSLGAAVLSIVLGVYVLQKNRKSSANRIFFLLMLGSFIWGGGEFVHRITNGGLWFIISNLGLLLIPPSLFHFTFVYPNDVLSGTMKRIPFMGVYFPAFVLAIALVLLIGPLFGLLILGIILFFFLFVIASLIRIVWIYIMAKDDLTKVQAIYLTIGLIIILLIISMELVMGSLVGTNWFILIADSLIIFFLAMFFAIAVLRYRLVDVEIIFKKSAFYSSMSIVLGSFFLAFTESLEAVFAWLSGYIPAFQSLPDQAMSLIAAFMVVLAIAPARMVIKRILDRVFPQSRKFEKEYMERLEAYEQTLRGMWADGTISDREREALITLRKKLDLTKIDHDEIEKKLMSEMRR